jgi:hypothetical protein
MCSDAREGDVQEEFDIAAGLLPDGPQAGVSKPNWRHPRELGAAEVGAFLTHPCYEPAAGRGGQPLDRLTLGSESAGFTNTEQICEDC